MQTVRTLLSLQEASVRLPASVKLIDTLYRALQQPDVDIDQVVGLMTMDIGITTRLLRMANTASYSRGETVTSFEQALTWLGMAQAYRVTCATLSAKLCEQGLPLYGITGGQLLANSIALAVGMELIAKKTELDPKTAYTLGLLHNLGRIVLQKMALPLELPRGAADLPDPAAVNEWERENLGCTQAEAAAGVFSLWGLNSLFSEVTTHYDEREATESAEVRRWAELLHLTVTVVETTPFKLGIKSDTVALPETIFADVGLPPLDLEKLGGEITAATQVFCEQSGLHLQVEPSGSPGAPNPW